MQAFRQSTVCIINVSEEDFLFLLKYSLLDIQVILGRYDIT